MPGGREISTLVATGQVAPPIAIQGERGSNSHLAVLEMLGPQTPILPCELSAEVIAAVLSGQAQAAVLPIENSLHGSVAEHYDLLLTAPLRIDQEYSLRVRHNLLAPCGTGLDAIRRVFSHPVALSQCRRFLAGFRQAKAQSFTDTAGSLRYVVEQGLTDSAAIAPALAAEVYGAEILLSGIEDHPENYTRFHLLRPETAPLPATEHPSNKLSVAFHIEHRPGTLVKVLEALAAAGGDLTKIESRPVPGKPWQYSFFVDLRFRNGDEGAERAVAALRATTEAVRELGRYRAAALEGISLPSEAA